MSCTKPSEYIYPQQDTHSGIPTVGYPQWDTHSRIPTESMHKLVRRGAEVHSTNMT